MARRKISTTTELREVAKQMENVTTKEDVALAGEDFPDLEELTEGELAEDWEPAAVVRVGIPGRTGVPAYDDDLDADPHAAPQVYPAWKRGETFVFSRVLAEGDSKAQWRRYAMEKYGAILEEYLVTGKYVARVPVPGGPHDPRRKN